VVVPLSWCVSIISLEGVATVEELADVTTIVHVEHKLATRVIVDVLSHVENKVIKYHQLLAYQELLIEVSRREVWCVFLDDVLVILANEASMEKFIHSHRNDDEKQVSNNKPRSLMKANLGIEAEHAHHNTRADRSLHPQKHEVAKVHVDSLSSEHLIGVPLISSASLKPCKHASNYQH